jgi:hypothetical protein
LDQKLILVTLLIRLGVAAAISSVLVRARRFRVLLFREERTLTEKIEIVFIVGTPIAGWHAFVFQATDGSLCTGSAAFSGPDRGFTSYGCIGSVDPPVVPPGVWVQRPEFEGSPTVSGYVLAIGLVRGPAKTVTLTFLGRPATAPVVPVPEPGWEGLGAYCMWLPTNGATTYGTANVTDVQALDANGYVVTSLP